MICTLLKPTAGGTRRSEV